MITSKNKQYISNENKLKERCRDNNIKYNPPTGHETTNMTRSRREKMLLLLKDPGAIERRNKKRKIDSNRERQLTDDQRKNKNMKQRIKRKNETESQRRNRLDRHNEQRRMRRKISKARAISNHNNNDKSCWINRR